MTPLQLKKHRKKLKLSQRKYAAQVGTSLRSIQNWEQGCRPIPSWLSKQIKGDKIDTHVYDDLLY